MSVLEIFEFKKNEFIRLHTKLVALNFLHTEFSIRFKESPAKLEISKKFI